MARPERFELPTPWFVEEYTPVQHGPVRCIITIPINTLSKFAVQGRPAKYTEIHGFFGHGSDTEIRHMGKLTVKKIQGAAAKAVSYKLIDGNGLQLRVATSGVKTWLVRYMVDGAEKQYRLPRAYRDSGGEGFASLHDAREEAAKIRALARQGIDYQVQLEQSNRAAAMRLEAERAASRTMNDLFDAWIPTTQRKDKGKELRRIFGRDVLPFIGTRPVKEVTEDDISKVVRRLVSRGADRLAVMLLADLKQMFRWAETKTLWRRLIEDNPVIGIRPAMVVSDDYDGTERTRTLSEDEIRELATKLPQAGLTKRTE